MNYALERVHKKDNTRIILSERSYTCGRGKDNDIICINLLVSRKHCIFFRDNENLYVTDLQSSNGTYINGDKKPTYQMIKLRENDIIGIGCPSIKADYDEEYIYKICIVKLPIEEEVDSNSSPTSVNRVLRRRCDSSDVVCDDIRPNKVSKIDNRQHDNKNDDKHNNNNNTNIGFSKNVDSNLSNNNQCPNSSGSANNLVENDMDDDIKIIHASLAKEIEKDIVVNDNTKSIQHSRNKNETNSEENMDISSVEDNDDHVENKNISKNVSIKACHTEKSSFVSTNNQIDQNENELEMTDDEEAAVATNVKSNMNSDKSPIKLKKIRHEPKTQFSVIDVVDLSDDEEFVFPYSQLFDIKYEDNTESAENKVEKKCADNDELNTEKIDLLNVDDEIIILTDSEDEDNPWLERLSRSQLLNEDIKPVFCESIIKDEIDLGIWDDEISNIIEQSEISNINQIPCNTEIPFKSKNIDIKVTNKKSDYNTDLQRIEAMDVDKISSSNEFNIKNINKNEQINSINSISIKEKAMGIDAAGPSGFNMKELDTSKKVDIYTDLRSEKHATDIDEANIPKKSNKYVDENEQIVDMNITSTMKENMMDIDKVSSNEPSAKDIDKSKQLLDTKAKMQTNANKQKIIKTQNVQIDEEAIETVKQKLIVKSISKKLTVIEPLQLPSKRRQSRSSSKCKGMEVNETVQTKSKEKKKLMQIKERIDNSTKKQKSHRKEFKLIANNSLSNDAKPGSSITKDERRKIIENRKIKLKEIAAEEKKLAAENNQSTSRRIAKPRAKVSLKNRGDFLITEQEPHSSKLLLNKSEKVSNSSNNQSTEQSTCKNNIIKKSVIFDKTSKADHKTDVPKDSMSNITVSLQQSLHLDNTSTASEDTALDSKTVNKKRKHNKNIISNNKNKSNKSADFTDKTLSEKLMKSDVLQSKPILSNNLKSSLKLKKKKRVSFSDKLDIKVYDIDHHNTLKKLCWKDAPIPTNKLTKAHTNYVDWRPKLEEFLLRIFMWNPVWLEEQRYFKQEPPIVLDSELQPMRLSYDSFKQYYEIAMPLLLLEVWCLMTKDFEMVEKNMQRATMMCSIVENSITRIPIPSTNLFLTTLTLEVLINKDDMNKQKHPVYGDLVFLEYVTNVRNKQIFHKIFAYITNMQHVLITDFTHYNRELKNFVKNPCTVITYTLLTRTLEHDIVVNRMQRIRTVTYLRANIRMVQALQYLPHSSLMNLIINPKIENYQLPPLDVQYSSSSLVTKDNLNPRQMEAVFRVTNAVLKEEAKLCFIQGPPGTGKTKVIVNLVTQILYGRHQEEKSLKILICAPSNAAIDELVLRLLSVRSTLRQKRFNMVRIGRSESMHPMTKTISVPELARKYLTKVAQKSSDESSMDEDIALLQARINSLKAELENTSKMNETKRMSLKNKLFEASTKYDLLKSGRNFDQLNAKDRAKYLRISENIIIMGANIIACTLSSCYTNQMESIFGGNKEKISVCIVDEATQSCEAETLIPLMLGINTLVLVGDPNQLPATILSQRAKKLGLDQSVFSRVQNVFASQANNPIIMLDTQYRMDYAISYWPNKYFYNGKLKNAAECRMKFPFHAYRVLNHDFIQNDDKFSNTTEALFIANIIFTMLMFAKWETPSGSISVGILTPYNNQRTLILSKINEKISYLPDNLKKRINYEVNTVDSFQGQERDVIIMSCVRSNGIGFLSDRQRLCVALTRAKHSLILCGNFNTFMKDPMWKALLNDARDRGILFRVDAHATPAVIKRFIIK